MKNKKRKLSVFVEYLKSRQFFGVCMRDYVLRRNEGEVWISENSLADPIQGVATVERFCDSKTGGHFGTTETTVGRGFMSSLEQPRTVAPNQLHN